MTNLLYLLDNWLTYSISPLLLPAYMLPQYSSSEWQVKITAEQMKLEGQDREACKHLYLDMARTLKYYGSSVFNVQVIYGHEPPFDPHLILCPLQVQTKFSLAYFAAQIRSLYQHWRHRVP